MQNINFQLILKTYWDLANALNPWGKQDFFAIIIHVYSQNVTLFQGSMQPTEFPDRPFYNFGASKAVKTITNNSTIARSRGFKIIKIVKAPVGFFFRFFSFFIYIYIS